MRLVASTRSCGAAVRSRADLGDAVEQLLEVVEHEQQRAVVQLRVQRRVVSDAERVRDRRNEQRRVGHRREVDEHGAVSQRRRELLGDGERESRLARAAGAGQRHEPRVRAKQRRDRRGLDPPADERRRRRGETRGETRPLPRSGERRVLAQHGTLELLQRRARLDAELLDEHLTRRAVGLERVLLPAGAIEREDLLLPQALAVRVLRDERRELADELLVPAERELRVVPQLDRGDARAPRAR